MNKHFKTIFNVLVKPFIEKSLAELQSTNSYDEPRAHSGQSSTQTALVVGGASIASIAQSGSIEATIASIVGLVISLILLYRREKKD